MRKEPDVCGEKVFIVAGLPHYTYFLRTTNRAVKRYSIVPSAEGNRSWFCYQSGFAAIPNRRLVLLDKTPRLWHKSSCGAFVRMERSAA